MGLLQYSKKRRALAERSRRALLLIDGLGTEMSAKEYADLLCSFPKEAAKKHEDPNYFSSTDPPGPRRLAVMLQESVFWSKHLLSACAKRFWIFFGVSLAISITLLLSTAPFLPNQKLTSVAKIVCLLLSLVISSDILGRAVDYFEASRAVSEIDGRLEKFLSSNSDPNDLLFIFCDYNAAVETAPVICSGVYEQYKSRLIKLWNTRTRSG
jgi:hypothetical protein